VDPTAPCSLRQSLGAAVLLYGTEVWNTNCVGAAAVLKLVRSAQTEMAYAVIAGKNRIVLAT
jgi:hypothetical protein